jgi:hypothetical protein
MLPFLKLNPKSQTTMDDIDILVFFMAISQVKKKLKPSIIHKRAEKLNKRGEENETSTKAQQ